MPIRFEASIVYCQGECMVEDALPLLEFLRTHEGVRIDMEDCTYAHTAVLQALAAATIELKLPASPEMARWVGAVMGATCV
jgi:hypothetical protein